MPHPRVFWSLPGVLTPSLQLALGLSMKESVPNAKCKPLLHNLRLFPLLLSLIPWEKSPTLTWSSPPVRELLQKPGECETRREKKQEWIWPFQSISPPNKNITARAEKFLKVQGSHCINYPNSFSNFSSLGEGVFLIPIFHQNFREWRNKIKKHVQNQFFFPKATSHKMFQGPPQNKSDFCDNKKVFNFSSLRVFGCNWKEICEHFKKSGATATSLHHCWISSSRFKKIPIWAKEMGKSFFPGKFVWIWCATLSIISSSIWKHLSWALTAMHF